MLHSLCSFQHPLHWDWLFSFHLTLAGLQSSHSRIRRSVNWSGRGIWLLWISGCESLEGEEILWKYWPYLSLLTAKLILQLCPAGAGKLVSINDCKLAIFVDELAGWVIWVNHSGLSSKESRSWAFHDSLQALCYLWCVPACSRLVKLNGNRGGEGIWSDVPELKTWTFCGMSAFCR